MDRPPFAPTEIIARLVAAGVDFVLIDRAAKGDPRRTGIAIRRSTCVDYGLVRAELLKER